MTDNLNDRLQQSMHGQPQTNIDERNQFMGSLRERTYLRLSVAQAQNEKLIHLFMKHFSEYKDYQILINGKIAQTELISGIISLCAKNDTQFSIISDETAHPEEDAAGILVVSHEAINEDKIDIEEKYQSELIDLNDKEKKDTTDQKDHPSFFDKLFGK